MSRSNRTSGALRPEAASSSILHDIDAICVKLPVRDPMAEQKLLTPLDVAKRLQINERTVTQWPGSDDDGARGK